MKICRQLLSVLFIITLLLCCQYRNRDNIELKSSASIARNHNSKLQKSSSTNDVDDYQYALEQLQTTLKDRDLIAASSMLHFPFFTAKMSDERGNEVATDPISSVEFEQYSHSIFSADVIRLLPISSENQSQAIDSTDNNSYYNFLGRFTDNESRLFEVYIQYPEPGTNAENYFAFIFGRVKGKYKAIGMYTKWSIK